jgi:toxin YoeB
MRKVVFTNLAIKEYYDWFETNMRIANRIKLLILEIDKDPFKGIGKPEPLRGNWKGYWSRRIDLEHRLVYKVTAEQITIVKCKGHY